MNAKNGPQREPQAWSSIKWGNILAGHWKDGEDFCEQETKMEYTQYWSGFLRGWQRDWENVQKSALKV